MKFNSYVIERQVKDETKKLDKSIPLEIRLVSRESLFPYNTFVSIINYMHFSSVWSRLTLTTAILFPVEPCPNNVFHIPAFIIGNINVTTNYLNITRSLSSGRCTRLPPTIFNVANFFLRFIPSERRESGFCKKRKKRIVIPFWRLWLFDFNFYFKGFISKGWKTDPNAYRVSEKSREKFCYLKNIPFYISSKFRNSIP